MEASVLYTNLINPPILCFFLGVFATLVRSDLEIPQPIPKLFSLYLLFAIGFQGGIELFHSGISTYMIIFFITAIASAIIIPIYTFFILRSRLNIENAGAIAASYGSVSVVTFMTAMSLLQTLGINFSAYTVAAMALMESPAIIIGMVLIQLFKEQTKKDDSAYKWRVLLHEAAFNGSVVLIVGSLFIGIFTGEHGAEMLKPFTQDIFKGMLSLFLLDMGLVAAKRMYGLFTKNRMMIPFAIVIPLINAMVAIGIAKLIGLSQGDALLFTVLCSSASYIAVPAAMRLAVPKANPGLYIPMALGITFPFNIIVGLPLYLSIISRLWSS